MTGVTEGVEKVSGKEILKLKQATVKAYLDFCNGLVPRLSATKFALLQFVLHRFTKIDVVNANLIVSLFCLNSLIVPHCYEVKLC